MIQENYYQGFKKMCDRNPKITRIPTKKELEDTFCELSGMCYLVVKSGAHYNPAIVNPEIIEDQNVNVLFVDRTPNDSVPKEETKPTIHPNSESDIASKNCDQCKELKPLSAFRKKANKVPTWFDTCIQCQAKARLGKAKPAQEAKPESQPEEPIGRYCPKCDTIKDAKKHFGDKDICLECEAKERTEALSKITTEPIKTAFDAVMDQKIAEIKERERYIRVSTAQKYIKLGYEMGVKDTLENLNIQEPTFEEIMDGIDL